MADVDRTGITATPNPAVAAAGLAPVRPTNVRGLILALACTISFVLYLHRYVWGFIKEDVRREFGWDPATLGWLDGLFPLSYALGQIPSGMLCDWFGAHALLGGSILGWSLALGASALATGVVSMAAARLALGATQAACYPVLSKVSKNWFPVGMRTTAQGLIATFFGRAGGAASFFLFGTVLVGWLGLPWREAVAVFTLAGLAVGVLFLLLFRNTPREHPWANAAEAELVTASDPEAAHATHSRLRWGALLGSVSVWFLFLRAFAANLPDVIFVYWVPSYLRDAKGLSLAHAGALAALPLIGGALGGLFSGSMQSYFIRRTGTRRWVRRVAGLAGKGLAGVLMLASLALDDPVAIGLLFLAVKFVTDWEQPAEWGTVSDIAGRSAATVFACVNTVGSVGSVAGSVLTGYVLGHFSVNDRPTPDGWTAVFVLAAVEYFAAAACWLFIDCERPLEVPRPGETP
jgi:ACS family D-galactonate transporter-like MFS transporter